MRPHTNTHTHIRTKLSVLFVANSYIYSIMFGHFNVYSGLSPSKNGSGTEDLLVTF